MCILRIKLLECHISHDEFQRVDSPRFYTCSALCDYQLTLPLLLPASAESDICDLVSEMGLSEPDTAQLRDNLNAVRRNPANHQDLPPLLQERNRPPRPLSPDSSAAAVAAPGRKLSLTVWVIAARGLEPNWLLSPTWLAIYRCS